MVFSYQYADVHDFRKALNKYPLNNHTTVMTLGLLTNAKVSSHQLALILEDRLS